MNLNSTSDIVESYKFVQNQRRIKAGDNTLALVRYTMPNFQSTWFHEEYYNILDLFARGKIKKLMMSVPPQHGKSQGSSIHLPSDMIGHNPDLKIATICYSATKARKFGRKVKQLITDEKYQSIFDIKLASPGDRNYINTAEEMEIVGHDGFLKYIGYEGGLTGDPVDVLLMDDLYKDFKEANSPVIRENVWDWYITVADTRLHNDSQQLIVFTRWHEDDLVGRIEKTDDVKLLQDIEDLDNYDGWVKVNYEAIKTGEPNKMDPREKGEPLWPDRHSLKKLLKSKSKDPIKFDALYQGNPLNKKGRLYGKFKTYTEKPTIITRKSYCDTADKGEDWLLDVVYDVDADGYCYVVDVYYKGDPAEVTQPGMIEHLEKNEVNMSDIESNNGGRIFAMNIKERLQNDTFINWFHQSENKEARCISSAPSVMEFILMPENWYARWPEFYTNITNFSRIFKSNAHDEAADVLTGITERRFMYTPNEESLFI